MKKVIKKERLSVYMDSKLLSAVKKEAEKNSRTAAGHVLFLIKNFLHAKPESGA